MNTARALVLVSTIVFPLNLVAAAPAFPAGSYESGGITLKFDGSGNFAALKNGTSVVEGIYKTEGDKLTLTDLSGQIACPKEESGTYIWRSDKSALTLTKVEDACDERASDLTAHPWQRQ